MFRAWAAEKTDHPREVVEAAYLRTDLSERRRRLMADWAAYLAGERQELRIGASERRLRCGPFLETPVGHIEYFKHLVQVQEVGAPANAAGGVAPLHEVVSVPVQYAPRTRYSNGVC